MIQNINANIAKWDILKLTVVPCGQSGELQKTVKEHRKQINDIQTSVDLTMFITASKDNTAKVRHPHYWENVTVILIFLLFNVRLCNCFSSALWFQFSGPHRDFQDREARQLCCHLSHFGSRKWSFINGSLRGRQIHANPWIWPIMTDSSKKLKSHKSVTSLFVAVKM